MSRTMVEFAECPECGVTCGRHGLARHRKSAHGVEPVTTRKAKAPKLTAEERAANLAERLAKIEAWGTAK